MKRLLADLAWAIALLTRLPVAYRDGRQPAAALAASVWAYPVVGAGVGALGGSTYSGLLVLGLSPVLCTVLALAAMVAVTGALHEDGLADTADGLGGGATRERKLEIMRDHAIGIYGAVTLGTALALRAGAMLALGDPVRIAIALVVAGALSRSGMVALMRTLPPARREGLAAGIPRPAMRLVAAALALALMAAFLLLPVVPALTSIGLAALACATVGWMARRQLGGITGDVLGAAQQAAECVALVALSAALT